MEYVEFLRMRRSLLWHVGILAAIALLIALVSGNDASVNINGSTKLMSGMRVPVGLLATIAAFYGAIFASSAGTSLNRENTMREISWTKPMSRTVLAVWYIVIDVIGITIAYTAAIAAIAAVLLHLHIAPFLDAEAVPQLVLGLGISLMWYALIQVVSCMMPPAGRALSGVMWPIAFGIGIFTQIPGSIGAVARVVNVINPLSYLSNSGSSGSHMYAASGQPVELRGLIVWCFAAAFCAITVAIWPKAEA